MDALDVICNMDRMSMLHLQNTTHFFLDPRVTHTIGDFENFFELRLIIFNTTY